MTNEQNQSTFQIPEWVDTVSPSLYTLKAMPQDENVFCRDVDPLAMALKLEANARHKKEEWWVWSLLILPDRMFALISVTPNLSSQMSIANFKRFTDRTLKINWRRGFKEIPIEDQDALEEAAAYVKSRPVERGFCETIENWPYHWTSKDFAG
jgi:REP element-mobilizing transposase RayT